MGFEFAVSYLVQTADGVRVSKVHFHNKVEDIAVTKAPVTGNEKDKKI